jgi:hypothetical protein
MTGTLDPGDTAQRRLLIAASCVLAPAALLAAFLIGPSMAYDDAATSLTDVAAGRATSVAQAMLLLISSALFVPVLIGAVNLLRRRGRTVGTLGAIAFLAGICGHLMLVGTRLVLVQMAAPGANRTAMVDLAHRLGRGVFTVITPLELCFDIGLVLMFIGLRRASAVPTWVLAVIVAVAVAAGVLGSTKAAFVIAGIGGLIAGTYVGVRIARADHAAWSLGYLTREPTEQAQLPQLAPAG